MQKDITAPSSIHLRSLLLLFPSISLWTVGPTGHLLPPGTAADSRRPRFFPSERVDSPRLGAGGALVHGRPRCHKHLQLCRFSVSQFQFSPCSMNSEHSCRSPALAHHISLASTVSTPKLMSSEAINLIKKDLAPKLKGICSRLNGHHALDGDGNITQAPRNMGGVGLIKVFLIDRKKISEVTDK